MTHDPLSAPPPLQTIALRAGEQVFVNGTLIEAAGPCALRLSSQASIVRGARPRRGADVKRALSLLYQETLRAEGSPERLREARPGLLSGLNVLTACLRTQQGQAHCASYATALACGDIHAALAALRGLSHAVRHTALQDEAAVPDPGPQIPLAANT